MGRRGSHVNRDVMFDAIRDRFDQATPLGPNPASL
jgi:hypothetical protein